MIKRRKGIVWAAGVLCSSWLYGSCADLVRAYPDFIEGCKTNTVIWRDGTKMVYDDGRRKSFAEALNHPDIEDMFRYSYPRGAARYNRTPPVDFDPGRIRYEPLFKKMYGASASEVRKHLTSIKWFGQKVRVTKVNGVAARLRAVERDLASRPELKKYLTPVGGTFKWRYIAGTKRLSVHSFGAAIDINVKHSAYWRWSKGKYRYRNEIPLEIVKAFERHGFIWGGKWYHYDTMHFEYRPELLGIGSDRAGHEAKAPRHKSAKISEKSHREKAVGTSYVVSKGDTLYAIAKKYDTTPEKLKELNSLESDDIKVGQKLRVPGRDD